MIRKLLLGASALLASSVVTAKPLTQEPDPFLNLKNSLDYYVKDSAEKDKQTSFDEANNKIEQMLNHGWIEYRPMPYLEHIEIYIGTKNFIDHILCSNANLRSKLNQLETLDKRIVYSDDKTLLYEEAQKLLEAETESECKRKYFQPQKRIIYITDEASFFPYVKRSKKIVLDSSLQAINPMYIFEHDKNKTQSSPPVIRIEFDEIINSLSLEYFFVPKELQKNISDDIGKKDFDEIDTQYYEQLTKHPKSKILDINKDGIRSSLDSSSTILNDSLCITINNDTLCHEFIIQEQLNFDTNSENSSSIDLSLKQKTIYTYLKTLEITAATLENSYNDMSIDYLVALIIEEKKLIEAINNKRIQYAYLLPQF